MTSKILCFIAFLQLAISSTASVGLTAYDGFDYAAGDLTGKNGGSGWSGAFTDSGNSTIYTTPGLTYAGLPTTGGASKTGDGGTATTINFRGLGVVYGDDEVETWISFLAQRNGAASTATFAGISFYNTGGIAAANSEVSIANGGTGGSGVVILKYPDFLTASFSAGVTQTTTSSAGYDISVITATATTNETVK